MRLFMRIIIVAAAAVLVWTSGPERLARLDVGVDQVEARPGGRGGGFKGRGSARPRGAKTRHRSAARPRTGASRQQVNRPRKETRPAAGNRPQAGNRPNKGDRPQAGNRPGKGDRPQAGNRPGKGDRPQAGNRPGKGDGPIAGRPGNRPPGSRPPGHRPPNLRPPGGRPPGWRPPGYRPPHWRPPAWRPPYYRPPYYRPPHAYWGSYYWYPSWGWYFTATLATATLVYVATLPEDNPCEEVKLEDETLYVCDGVLYRPTYYKDELVYEIVSDEKDAPIPPPESAPASGGDLRLTSPPMSGPGVAALQGALATRGFDPGGTDGIFGQGTDRALRAYQEAEGLPVTGVLDEATAAALGL